MVYTASSIGLLNTVKNFTDSYGIGGGSEEKDFVLIS